MMALPPPRLMIATLVILSLLPSCRESREARANSQWWELEAKRVALEHEVQLLDMRIGKIEAKRKAGQDMKDVLSRTAQHRSDLENHVAQLRQEIEQGEGEMTAMKGEWTRKVRAASVGRSLDSLSGTNGKVFSEVVITRVTDVGVEFRHSTGTARLSADQLGPEDRDSFALDTAIAQEAIQEESELAAAYDSWVDEGVAANAVREASRQEALLAEREDQRQLAVAQARASRVRADTHDSGASSSALRKQARAFGTGRTIWYPSYRSYRTRYYYVPTRSYCAPTPYRVPATPSFRSASKNWTYAPKR